MRVFSRRTGLVQGSSVSPSRRAPMARPAAVRAKGHQPLSFNGRDQPAGSLILDIVATPSNANRNWQGRLLALK
jgi:hypothetical protein